MADERFFLIRTTDLEVSAANWTELEHEVMSAHRWWPHADLKSTADQVWPENLAQMLIDAGAWKPLAARQTAQPEWPARPGTKQLVNWSG